MEVFMKLKSLSLAAGLLLMSANASATFSIVAYDSSTGQFGAALASCVRVGQTTDISDFLNVIVPTKGVFTTQATVNFPNTNLENAKAKIQSGNYNGDQIIQWLKANDQDSTPNVRQYLTLSTTEGFAYSGSKIPTTSGSLVGSDYVIAGNTLDPNVLTTMQQGFTANTGNLKSKLLAALTSVQNANIGDNRCTKYGVSSHTAFVKVGTSSAFYNSQTNSKDAIAELAKLIPNP